MTPSTTVSSILRNPIYTVRSHRVVPCGSPPVPRDAGPQSSSPRYAKTLTLFCISAVQSPGWRAIVALRPMNREASWLSWESAAGAVLALEDACELTLVFKG